MVQQYIFTANTSIVVKVYCKVKQTSITSVAVMTTCDQKGHSERPDTLSMVSFIGVTESITPRQENGNFLFFSFPHIIFVCIRIP